MLSMRVEDLHERLVEYERREELANRLTHGLGVVLCIIGMSVLIGYAVGLGERTRLISACIYGIAAFTFYCFSTAYHTVTKPTTRYVFRILDHVGIYIMIAGSYTPFAMVTLQGPWGRWLLGTVWGLGTVGAILKIFTTHRLRVVGPVLYIALGWLALVAIKPLAAALPYDGLALLFGGGIAYTVGVLFYMWDRLPFNHAIWHVFVLAGSVCHFLAIFFYVIPKHS